MRKKYKLTGFARFFIFMLFFAPVSYIGVSYYQGENGLEKVKDFFNSLRTEQADVSPDTPSMSSDEIIKMQAQEIELLKQRIEELESRLANLESQEE
ncbi:MAG: hypothetical protein HKN68_21730 [Saprospiraceae bacterium]|nr:hypothetical protein [Saprospiraceae bacterium]